MHTMVSTDIESKLLMNTSHITVVGVPAKHETKIATSNINWAKIWHLFGMNFFIITYVYLHLKQDFLFQLNWSSNWR